MQQSYPMHQPQQNNFPQQGYSMHQPQQNNSPQQGSPLHHPQQNYIPQQAWRIEPTAQVEYGAKVDIIPKEKKGFLASTKAKVFLGSLLVLVSVVGILFPKSVDIQGIRVDGAQENFEIQPGLQVTTLLQSELQNNNFLPVEVIFIDATMEYEGIFIGKVALGEVGTLAPRDVSFLKTRVLPDISEMFANAFTLLRQANNDCAGEDAKGTMTITIEGFATGSVFGGAIESDQPLSKALEFPCLF
mmetsp:Transcript_21600/g.40340  ORF Transcript_21600/g.40340 Transcript_21600/m.40340 type:complete len:244 (+) Transcript_21600:210-941(+)